MREGQVQELGRVLYRPRRPSWPWEAGPPGRFCMSSRLRGHSCPAQALCYLSLPCGSGTSVPGQLPRRVGISLSAGCLPCRRPLPGGLPVLPRVGPCGLVPTCSLLAPRSLDWSSLVSLNITAQVGKGTLWGKRTSQTKLGIWAFSHPPPFPCSEFTRGRLLI